MESIRVAFVCVFVLSIVASIEAQTTTLRPTPSPPAGQSTTKPTQLPSVSTSKPTQALSGASGASSGGPTVMMTTMGSGGTGGGGSTPSGGGGSATSGSDMEVWKLIAIIVPSIVGGLTVLSICFFCCWGPGATLAGCCAAGPAAAGCCGPQCGCGTCCDTERQVNPYMMKEQRFAENPHYNISSQPTSCGCDGNSRGGNGQVIVSGPKSCGCGGGGIPSRSGNGLMMVSAGPMYTSSAQIMPSGLPRPGCNHC